MKRLLALPLLFVAFACRDANRPVAVDSSPGPAATVRPGAMVELPPDHPPIGEPPVQAPAAPPSAAAGAGALVFTPQEGWVVETPKSAMRKAQYRLPKVEGDAEDAELVVFHFGTAGGGGIEANVQRWCSQFAQPDGRPSKEVLERSQREVAGMRVHEVALAGTFVAETSPGSGEHVNKPGFRMLAAIVEVSEGNAYYLKLVGPASTVARWEPAWRAFVSAIRRAE